MGVTKIGTHSIFASYSYSRINLTNTQLQTALDRAQTEIDVKTNNHFVTGSSVTPDWIKIVNEQQEGKGTYDKDYYTRRYPIGKFITNLVGTSVSGTSVLKVNSTNKFPSSGNISVNNDKITYTAKVGDEFQGCTGITESHGIGGTANPFVVEISTTSSGTDPEFSTLKIDTDFDMDEETGKVHLYRDDYGSLSILDNTVPPRMIPNRLRVTYLAGEDPIAGDIERVTLMLASKDIMHSAVRKAIMDGNNEFNPDMIGVDTDWINEIIDRYNSRRIRNT